MNSKKRLTEEEISEKLNTPEGLKELAQAMADGLKTRYLIKPPEPKPKFIPPSTLTDIKGKTLKVGQYVVFCLSATDTELATGIIQIVSPQSVYIKLDKECVNKYRKDKPYFTKKLINPYNHKPDYNRLEVMIIP
jgi:hypothetical protein